MNGIPFRVNGKGQVLVSWMSRNKTYWSLSDAEARHFAGGVATPDRGGREALSVAVANRKGEVMFVWLNAKRVEWALYRTDGKFTGKQGVAGEQETDNKPTAFVGADDEFYILF